jgi:hypothetical protein
MPPLASNLRKQLDNAVQQAREIAETAGRAALQRLGVPESRRPDYLDAEQARLRNRLRAHARQLGDTLYADDRQDTERLVAEIAYQQWHRMLFARFLAENGLLIHPDFNAPVTLADCAELAEDEGVRDAWTLAGRFAARMLPQIFRPDEPALALAFAPEHQRALEQLLEGLPAETFTASDALGWVYQFWQSKRKDEVNRSGVKIGADELPAVTQLFTEQYMVLFLLHNTLGAWWTGKHPDEAPPVELEYLRRLDDGTPAAGIFDGWPATARELRVMDPCCGSGHFLVAAFAMLVPMRMREEGVPAREACERVIADNLFGLEIDERCTQIAAFALALAAWTYPGAGGYRPLPEMNIACSGLAVGAKREEWLALGNGDERLRQGMDRLYSLFKDAPVLGSLIDPKRSSGGDLFAAEFSELQPLLQKALEREKGEGDYTGEEIGIAAQGIAKAAELLTGSYTIVCTNPPFLGRGKQVAQLRLHLELNFSSARQDLATAFVQRGQLMRDIGGSQAFVTPHNWFVQASYESLRTAILQSDHLVVAAILGEEAFDSFGIRGPRTALIILGRDSARSPEQGGWAIDVSSPPGSQQVLIPEKMQRLKCSVLLHSTSAEHLSRPAHRILFGIESAGKTLRSVADSYQGLKSGDDALFRRFFWEILLHDSSWKSAQGSPLIDGLSGVHYLLRWSQEGKTLARLQGLPAWGRTGVAIGTTRKLKVTAYEGDPFFSEVVVILPKDSANLSPVTHFATTGELERSVRQINRGTILSNDIFLDVPFRLEEWQRSTADDGLNGGDSHPTERAFDGRPDASTEPLQVAVARLLGYRWPEQEPDALDALADDDGIVCLPAVGGELPAADRLQALLIRAYGDTWSPGRTRELLEQAGSANTNLADWLRDDFFKHHCKTFANRPFVWHIWDGRKDGFGVLVNYHRLDRAGLEKLTYTYLGDWTERQRADAAEDVPGADLRLAAARELKTKLEAILAGEPPYDVFVRWKQPHEQPIGWDPDLNDGVRLNVRPFVGAGVLRSKFNVHWRKDRGKNPPGDPWGEERINDRHLSRAEKQQARREAAGA